MQCRVTCNPEPYKCDHGFDQLNPALNLIWFLTRLSKFPKMKKIFLKTCYLFPKNKKYHFYLTSIFSIFIITILTSVCSNFAKITTKIIINGFRTSCLHYHYQLKEYYISLSIVIII